VKARRHRKLGVGHWLRHLRQASFGHGAGNTFRERDIMKIPISEIRGPLMLVKKARKDMTSSELHASSVQGSDLPLEEKDEDLGSQCP
jgi:hypothetical protein